MLIARLEALVVAIVALGSSGLCRPILDILTLAEATKFG